MLSISFLLGTIHTFGCIGDAWSHILGYNTPQETFVAAKYLELEHLTVATGLCLEFPKTV